VGEGYIEISIIENKNMEDKETISPLLDDLKKIGFKNLGEELGRVEYNFSEGMLSIQKRYPNRDSSKRFLRKNINYMEYLLLDTDFSLKNEGMSYIKIPDRSTVTSFENLLGEFSSIIPYYSEEQIKKISPTKRGSFGFKIAAQLGLWEFLYSGFIAEALAQFIHPKTIEGSLFAIGGILAGSGIIGTSIGYSKGKREFNINKRVDYGEFPNLYKKDIEMIHLESDLDKRLFIDDNLIPFKEFKELIPKVVDNINLSIDEISLEYSPGITQEILERKLEDSSSELADYLRKELSDKDILKYFGIDEKKGR
jgi:hypothetical protein